MLKKNCHQVLRSQKSKLTPPELVFQTAGAINPPPYKDRVKSQILHRECCCINRGESIMKNKQKLHPCKFVFKINPKILHKQCNKLR